MKRRAFMTDSTVSKMGLSMNLGLLMLDLGMMDTVDLAMMRRIKRWVVKMLGIWTQGLIQLSQVKC